MASLQVRAEVLEPPPDSAVTEELNSLGPTHCIAAVAEIGTRPLGLAGMASPEPRVYREAVLEIKLVPEGKVELLAPLALCEGVSADEAEEVSHQFERLEGVCRKKRKEVWLV